MPAHVVSYRRTHRFPGDPESLWASLARVDRYEQWWPWLSELRCEGPPLTTGSSLAGVVAPPVPYRMRVQVALTRCERPSAIDAEVGGDLRGPALLRLRPEGDGTTVEIEWSVEMLQRPMRLADRVAHPLLQWGHDRVVDLTLAGFRNALG